jgi:hypothetical protein
MEMEMKAVVTVNDENNEKQWKQWKQLGKRQIIEMDSEGTVSDDDETVSGSVCRMFLI